MAEFDFRDLYIGYPGHPRFKVNRIITDDIIRVIIQKYEMILFTNKGELFGDPDFGADLEKLLHETRISAPGVRNIIIQQINKYIPELIDVNYVLKVSFEQDPERFQDVMVVEFTIADYEVYALID
jgi:phage baseplate assembly protein W